VAAKYYVTLTKPGDSGLVRQSGCEIVADYPDSLIVRCTEEQAAQLHASGIEMNQAVTPPVRLLGMTFSMADAVASEPEAPVDESRPQYYIAQLAGPAKGEWLRELHAACIAGEARPDTSEAFRNLRRKLEAPGDDRDSIGRLRRSRGRTRRWWPWALAAEFAVIIVLGGLLLTSTEGPVLYRTLGATDAGKPATGSLVVIFDPTTSQAEVQRILRSAGARIVDGPTQANAYVLEVPVGQTDWAAQAIKTERAALLIEPLGPQGAR
jgi:hypothetical protein